MSKKYKATVHISGATTQNVYHSNLDTLTKRAVKLLTEWEPGGGSLWPEKVVLLEHVRQTSGNSADWKEVMTILYKSLTDDQLEWKIRHKTKRAELANAQAARRTSECKMPSPLTGQLCTMGRGHAGPHQCGGPYHTVESFVTQCPEGKCVYHPNRGQMSVMRWEECIHCGHRKPLHMEQYILETPVGAAELFAVNDDEAIHFALQHLAQTRVTQIPGVPLGMFSALKLFRYPKTGGLVEVAPFVSALSTRTEL